MSGHGLHVHGPHDHELEHAAQHGDKDSLASQVAVTTAIVTTVGALFSYMAGATQADAGLFKNNAAIKKTEASNQWNYYQAKSSKQNLAELALALVATDRQPQYRQEVERYKKEKAEIKLAEPIQEKAEIKLAADRLEAEARSWDERSDAQMHQHHRWAQSTTALQVSIALAAMALLTRRKWLEWGMFALAGIGLALGALAAAHV